MKKMDQEGTRVRSPVSTTENSPTSAAHRRLAFMVTSALVLPVSVSCASAGRTDSSVRFHGASRLKVEHNKSAPAKTTSKGERPPSRCESQDRAPYAIALVPEKQDQYDRWCLQNNGKAALAVLSFEFCGVIETKSATGRWNSEFSRMADCLNIGEDRGPLAPGKAYLIFECGHRSDPPPPLKPGHYRFAARLYSRQAGDPNRRFAVAYEVAREFVVEASATKTVKITFGKTELKVHRIR